MADQDVRDHLWEIRGELPGVPEPLLFFHYMKTVENFCRESKAWHHSYETALDLNASTDWPTITAGTHIPANTYVVEPLRFKWSDGEVIHFMTRDQLDVIDGDWEQATGTRAKAWTTNGPKQWRVYPHLSANQTGVIYLSFAVAPTVTVSAPRTSLPQELFEEFSDVFNWGALSRLMKMPGKDWTNVKLAADYGTLYEQGWRMAKSRAAADYGRPRRQVEYGGLSVNGSGAPVSDDYGK